MSKDNPKFRILHPRLAAVLADLRHGELIYVGDAGSGTASKALRPLDPDVEIIDLAVATGVPTFEDVAGAIIECGDIEAAIVTNDMADAAPEQRQWLEKQLGSDNVHSMNYVPDYYELRDRCKVFIQTGDYGVHHQAVLIGGYPSANIPIEFFLGNNPFAAGQDD